MHIAYTCTQYRHSAPIYPYPIMPAHALLCCRLIQTRTRCTGRGKSSRNVFRIARIVNVASHSTSQLCMPNAAEIMYDLLSIHSSHCGLCDHEFLRLYLMACAWAFPSCEVYRGLISAYVTRQQRCFHYLLSSHKRQRRSGLALPGS